VNEFVITLVLLVGYLAVGAVIARCAAVSTARHYHHEFKHEPSRAEKETCGALTLAVVAWPFIGIGLIFFGIRQFVYAPVTKRQAHAEKLQADAKYWDGVAREEIDGEKKAMAEELARSLREQAKGVGL
jgi:hypothetical protein